MPTGAPPTEWWSVPSDASSLETRPRSHDVAPSPDCLPYDFILRLTEAEAWNLKCHIGISSFGTRQVSPPLPPALCRAAGVPPARLLTREPQANPHHFPSSPAPHSPSWEVRLPVVPRRQARVRNAGAPCRPVPAPFPPPPASRPQGAPAFPIVFPLFPPPSDLGPGHKSGPARFPCISSTSTRSTRPIPARHPGQSPLSLRTRSCPVSACPLAETPAAPMSRLTARRRVGPSSLPPDAGQPPPPAVQLPPGGPPRPLPRAGPDASLGCPRSLLTPSAMPLRKLCPSPPPSDSFPAPKRVDATSRLL
jgi:hypothetical protein